MNLPPDRDRSQLDLVSEPSEAIAQPEVGRDNRKFLGVRFQCCQVYTRIYLAADERCYRGNCPRCGKPVVFRVGHGGTSERFFDVY
ncbi:MAG: hypothetical protein RLY14_2257 [Planctomycetota bacterium]